VDAAHYGQGVLDDATTPIDREPPSRNASRRLAALGALGAIGALVTSLAGCVALRVDALSPGTAPPAETAPATAISRADLPPSPAGPALSAVALLPIKGRAPKTGYDRGLFGQAWLDTDRNGCDTRNDVLRRDLTDDVLKEGTRGCVLLTGTLHDPYTATTISFVRGSATSNAVQIDHVVPLSDAWQKGAQQWSGTKRTVFANDPLNLLAVDGPTNQGKGDSDVATWLPPSKDYRCAYAARIVAVKVAYGAWVTEAERDALVTVLVGCPTEQLPQRVGFVLGAEG
jgi:hypothetical protein